MALFNAESVYDTSPGIETYKRLFKEFDGYKRRFTLSAVDVNTGEKVTMNEHEVPYDDLPIAVLGSASVPGFFPATRFKEHLLIDGMTAYNTDV